MHVAPVTYSLFLPFSCAVHVHFHQLKNEIFVISLPFSVSLAPFVAFFDDLRNWKRGIIMGFSVLPPSDILYFGFLISWICNLIFFLQIFVFLYHVWMQDFYEHLFEELSKYGPIESLNMCDNLADHMLLSCEMWILLI